MKKPAEFKAKLYLLRDGGKDFIDQLIIFHNELDPIETGRSVEDWIREHIIECYGGTDLRELLGLPIDENDYHVLFSGTLQGFRSWTLDGDEYDEELEIDKGVKFIVLPKLIPIDDPAESLK